MLNREKRGRKKKLTESIALYWTSMFLLPAYLVFLYLGLSWLRPLAHFASASLIYIFGVASIALYLTFYELLSPLWEQRAINKLSELPSWVLDRIKNDLNQTASVLAGREESMIQVGSIFIAGAFFLVAGAFQAGINKELRVALVASAPVLYTAWLFILQLSTRLIHDAQAEALVTLEYPPMVLLRSLYGRGHGDTWIIRFRRNQWLAYLVVLTMASTIVAGS